MLEFWRKQWRAFQASYDTDEMLEVGSSPWGTLAAVAGQVGLLAAVGYVPPIAQHAQFNHPWFAILLTCVGGGLTYLSHRHRCRGAVGTLATLFDNACYSSAMAYAALNTQGGVAIGLAVVHAALVLGFTAQYYTSSLLLSLTLVSPVLGMLVVYPTSEAVLIILSSTLIMAHILFHTTGRRRELVRRQRKLEQALGVADQAADEGMQAALATMLLSLGHFLHELRNQQTAVSAGLSFIELRCNLDQESKAALDDAREAQAAEQQLVFNTMQELKQRSRSTDSSFQVVGVMSQVARESRGIDVVVAPNIPDVAIRGNSEHFRLVLVNIVRNALQAGAAHVHFEGRLEPSGQAVRLVLHDDGPGIAAERRDRIFQPFAESTKVEGTGLGLYLCRRYVGILGGSVSIEQGRLGGVAFVAILPIAAEPSSPIVESGPQSGARISAT